MDTKNIKLYTVQCHWANQSSPNPLFRTVSVGKPDFLNEKYSWEWTDEEQDLDDQIFFYYEDYAELNQHLKDGDETKHDFIVTKIIRNQN
jgi:hypothetical protein